MNIQATAEMYAGGPGSGCQGPNCGRPRTRFEEGDRAMLMKPVKAMDEKTLAFRKFPIGTEVTVREVFPSTGDAPQRVMVGNKRMHPEVVEEHELQFLKSGKVTKVDVQPVPKRYIKQQITLQNGAKYTIIRPEEKGEKRGPQNIMNKASRLKGEFDKPEKFYGVSDQPGQHLKSWVTEAMNPRTGVGATVFIHRYSDSQGRPTGVTIQEHPWAGVRHRIGTPLQFEFKNSGTAMGLIKSRYGISFKLKDWRA